MISLSKNINLHLKNHVTIKKKQKNKLKILYKKTQI